MKGFIVDATSINYFYFHITFYAWNVISNMAQLNMNRIDDQERTIASLRLNMNFLPRESSQGNLDQRNIALNPLNLTLDIPSIFSHLLSVSTTSSFARSADWFYNFTLSLHDSYKTEPQKTVRANETTSELDDFIQFQIVNIPNQQISHIWIHRFQEDITRKGIGFFTKYL